MSFKSVIVQADGGEQGAARLRAAAWIARSFGGRLIGVGATEYAVITDPGVGFTSARALKARYDQTDEDLKAAEAAFHACAAEAGVEAIWRRSLDSPAAAMAEEARCADLAVVARSDSFDRRWVVHGGDLIMTAGIPVLVAPPGFEQVEARTVLVAWKNTRESRRAVGESLPILKRARRIIIAAIQEGRDDARMQAELDDVADRLHQHGVLAETHLVPRFNGSVADQLIAVMQVHGCDFVVAGAFGHSRLREWIFGGVTERLLHATPVPALLSH